MNNEPTDLDDDIGGMEITKNMRLVVALFFACMFMIAGATLLALILWIV